MKYAGALNETLKPLADIPHWVAWEMTQVDGKSKKIPINPHTGSGAKANEPSTWADFDTAYEMRRKLTETKKTKCGVGFELGGGFAGIDLDGCIDDSGKLSDMAGKIVEQMNTYTEISPRGHGLHILCRVDDGFTLDGKQGAIKKNPDIEIYCGGHYLTVTGNVYGELKPIENRTEELLKIYHEYFPITPKNEVKKQPVNFSAGENHSGTTGNESDNELWDYMFNSPLCGANIRALFSGDISGYKVTHKDGTIHDDHSGADQALCNYLAYYTRHDAMRIDRMFRQSGLMRAKWDEKHSGTGETYGEMTVAKAMTIRNDPPLPVATSTNTSKYRPMSDFFNPETDWENDESGHDDGAVNDAGNETAGNTASKNTTADNSANEPHTLLTYLENSLEGDIGRVQKFSTRKTGYSNIDKWNSLFPGLYVLGAVSSLGKTTFLAQMADYLAQAGEQVLFFSLEQTELELATKGIARLTAQEFRNNHTADIAKGEEPLTKYEHTDAVTAVDIRNGRITPAIKRAIERYKTFAGNLRIIECGFETDINFILDTVQNFMNTHKVRPVVMVDYLQLVRYPNNGKGRKLTTKEAVDENVRAFKRMAVTGDLTVIVISSLNRQNYLNVVDFESFKETGSIEYSADVVWGMQLLAMNAEIFDSSAKLQAKRKFVSKAKNAKPRLIEIRGLKNRNGMSNTRYFFDYYPAHDLFIPCERKQEDVDAEMNAEFEVFSKEYESETKNGGKKSKRV